MITNAKHLVPGIEFINLESGVKPEIADNVIFNGVIDCIHKVKICKNVFSGHDVMILTGSHDYNFFGEDRRTASGGGSVYIDEGVWICTRAIIIGPCNIGKHSVIGAGTVISKDIPAYEMWIGSPPRCIKRFNHKVKAWERV